MQSNLAIAEELLRISAYLEPRLPWCTNEDCTASTGTAQSLRRDSESTAMARPGTNARTAARPSLSAANRPKRQRETHVNRDVFRHLVNTVPIRRIIKLLGISTSVLYDRIDFIYEQCRLFAGNVSALIDKTDLGRRRISIDRQKLMVNWSSKNSDAIRRFFQSRALTKIPATSTVRILNFDESMDDAEVSEDMVRFGDHQLAEPFRRYARVWLERDYERAAKRAEADERPRRGRPTWSSHRLSNAW